jgi:TetR/AcrR family transcriptional regulator, lmrAB and yxaGH operons repressor
MFFTERSGMELSVARPQTVETDIVIHRLSDLFRAEGFEGASLARLADCAGLKKASLYHRFPRGKQQMAEDVLAATGAWVQKRILAPLNAEGVARERLRAAMAAIDEFYGGGSRGCLLNMLAPSGGGTSPFAAAIAAMFDSLISSFAKLARDAGFGPGEANARAERCVALLEGGLVMARGMNSPARFKSVLASLPAELGLEP